MTHESKQITNASETNKTARSKIFELSKKFPGTDEEKERNPFLFTKASDIARFIAIQELYSKILNMPGCIADFGTWRGQTAIQCENLRAVYEPLNFDRRIYCFDTFEGYKGFTAEDKSSNFHKDGTYSTEENYHEYLQLLLKSHEGANAQGHIINKHKIVKGDITSTLPETLVQNCNEIFSLVFFDLNIYNVTKVPYDSIINRIPKGGIIAFWQLTRNNEVLDAEGKFYINELLQSNIFEIHKCQTYPSLVYLSKTQ